MRREMRNSVEAALKDTALLYWVTSLAQRDICLIKNIKNVVFMDFIMYLVM